DGTSLTDPIKSREELRGSLSDVLLSADKLMKLNIQVATDVTAGDIEVRHPDYPLSALQQVFRNAVMHRNYETSNAPVRLSWFSDRVEIQNPGGPFGQVNRGNFGTGVTDYRNPHLAEAMKNLGFNQRFGMGISVARKDMLDNGNTER